MGTQTQAGKWTQMCINGLDGGKRCSLSKDGNGGEERAFTNGDQWDIVGKVMVVVVEKIWSPLGLKMAVKVGENW